MEKQYNEWRELQGDDLPARWNYLCVDAWASQLMEYCFEAGYKKAVETLTQHIRVDPDE